jgi:hypothetical protein
MGLYRFLSLSAGILLVAVVAVFFMGCIVPVPQQGVPSVPAPSPASPVTVPVSSAPVGTGTTKPITLTATLPYGVTISYPQDWERNDVGTADVRDYGRTTVNIANFFSPAAIPKDPESYTTLGIDIDQSVDTDLEQYFNLATLALGKYYGSPFDITKHSYQLKISGYKSYELDWQTRSTRGIYIFTEAKGDIYIFSFKSQNTPPASGAFSDEIVEMYKSVTLNPPDVSFVKHR